MCSFLNRRIGVKHKNEKKETKFPTEISTPFQRLIFVWAIQEISSIKTMPPISSKARKIGRKTRNVTAQLTVTMIPSLISLDENVGQRVGYAVQHVLMAWDKFAVALGFDSSEELVTPYLSLEGCTFTCLPGHPRVNARVESRKTLLKEDGTRLEPTMNPELSFVNTGARSDRVDLALRKCAEKMLKDVANV